jgi:hypothetical protein
MAAASGGMVAVLEVGAGFLGGGSTVKVILAGHISGNPIMMTIHIMATVPRMDSLLTSAGMVDVDTAEIGMAGAGDK